MTERLPIPCLLFRFVSAARSAFSRSSSTSEWSAYCHRVRDEPMSRLLGDQGVHLLADAPVGGMSLRSGAQLDQVHRLARVHFHVETDAVGHRHRVRRDGGQTGGVQRIVQLGRGLHHLGPVLVRARGFDGIGLDVAVERGQRLPLERQHPVALQIPERAVVGQHVKPIHRPLERAPGLVSAVAALSNIRAQHAGAVVGRHRPRDIEQPIVGKIRHGVQGGRHDLDLAVGIEIGQRDFRSRRCVFTAEQFSRHTVDRGSGVGKILSPAAAAVRLIDARQERRDHLAQFGQHRARRIPDFPRAGWRACAGGALRRPGLFRTGRGSTARPPAAARGACRAPSRESRPGTPHRCRRRPWEILRGNAPASARTSARRSRTCDRASLRTGPAAPCRRSSAGT